MSAHLSTGFPALSYTVGAFRSRNYAARLHFVAFASFNVSVNFAHDAFCFLKVVFVFIFARLFCRLIIVHSGLTRCANSCYTSGPHSGSYCGSLFCFVRSAFCATMKVRCISSESSKIINSIGPTSHRRQIAPPSAANTTTTAASTHAASTAAFKGF
jgi:hypothetical protein